MKPLYLCTLLLGIAVPIPTHAIIVRHDVPDSAYVVDDVDHPALVDLISQGDCLATLVHESYLLTVAHCAVDLSAGDSLVIGSASHAVAEIILHPEWRDLDEFDIAVVRLERPVTGVAPLAIYRDSSELGSVIYLYGRGLNATGIEGEDGAESDGRLRAATNAVSGVDDHFIEIVFEREGQAGVTALEGVGAAGDSGGPAFIEVEGVRYVAGLNAYGDAPDGVDIGQYGASDYQTRVSRYVDWIDGIIDFASPTPDQPEPDADIPASDGSDPAETEQAVHSGCSTGGMSPGLGAFLVLALIAEVGRKRTIDGLSMGLAVISCAALSACVGAAPSDAASGWDDPGRPDRDGGAEPVSFDGCEGDSAAHDVFNSFWTTFDDEYAVFDARLTDTSWAAIGAQACERITPSMDDDDLFDLLLGMAQELDDGHITITAGDLGRDDDAEVSIYPHYDLVYQLEDLVEAEYLDTEFDRAAEDEISWGSIGDIGYVSITSMDELSRSGDEQDDVDAAAAAMSAAMADLRGLDGIIVDVRANEGGWDAVSLEIAAWFAGPRQLAWSEQIRNGPEHTDFAAPTDTHVDAGRSGGFDGLVVVLTSGGTYSAAETFVLAMRVRPAVVTLGETSSGHLSDMIDGRLPNGWTFTFSGERYIAADGRLYEAIGIPADVPMALDPSSLDQGIDPMLEAALARLP